MNKETRRKLRNVKAATQMRPVRFPVHHHHLLLRLIFLLPSFLHFFLFFFFFFLKPVLVVAQAADAGLAATVHAVGGLDDEGAANPEGQDVWLAKGQNTRKRWHRTTTGSRGLGP